MIIEPRAFVYEVFLWLKCVSKIYGFISDMFILIFSKKSYTVKNEEASVFEQD